MEWIGASDDQLLEPDKTLSVTNRLFVLISFYRAR